MTPHAQPPDRGIRRPLIAIAAVAAAAAGLSQGSPAAAVGDPTAPAAAAPATASAPVRPVRVAVPQGARLYVPPADPGARAQIDNLVAGGAPREAALIKKMAQTPQAVWLTGGTPAQVRTNVTSTVDAATKAGSLVTLVVYNVPARDCSLYSAGGANDTVGYQAWIDGIAAGIGNRAIGVLVEPDGLANLPSDCGQDDAAGTLSAARIAQIRYAATKLAANPRAAVYLDAGNSNWKGVGDITTRLIAAGVDRTNGFSLNVSNYELDSHSDKYGAWIATCIGYTLHQAGAKAANCASQYSPATAADFSTWGLSDAWYAANVTVAPTAHFVVDTSRNGLGPWAAPTGVPAGDPQVWCNPPDRGLGARPTTDTGNPLVDARLWVKTPGESDGQCYRWTSGPTDPARARLDPAAGAWFPDQALELARLAKPGLG